MAEVEITGMQLDCGCGWHGEPLFEEGADMIKCPECGHLYEIVVYAIGIDENGEYDE